MRAWPTSAGRGRRAGTATSPTVSRWASTRPPTPHSTCAPAGSPRSRPCRPVCRVRSSCATRATRSRTRRPVSGRHGRRRCSRSGSGSRSSSTERGDGWPQWARAGAITVAAVVALRAAYRLIRSLFVKFTPTTVTGRACGPCVAAASRPGHAVDPGRARRRPVRPHPAVARARRPGRRNRRGRHHPDPCPTLDPLRAGSGKRAYVVPDSPRRQDPPPAPPPTTAGRHHRAPPSAWRHANRRISDASVVITRSNQPWRRKSEAIGVSRERVAARLAAR